jgi:hypothetical protein
MSVDVSGSGLNASYGSFAGTFPVSQLQTGNIPQVAALPHAGVGSFQENTSVNFLLVGSVVMLLYVAVAFIIRRASGRRVEVEDDGITGL